MIARALSPTKPLIGVPGIVALGVLVALGTVLALNLIGTMKVAFAFGGLFLLLPAFLVRDARAYGLFVLVSSIPIDMAIHLTKWLVNPQDLLYQFGLPASGTLGVVFFVTDAVLIAMLLPWLTQLWLRQRSLYFPKIGYIFVLYLAWAVIVSLLEAPSLYLAMFELTRQILYFTFFLYIANNVVTRAQFRAVVLALLIGLVIAAGGVISFFSFGIGTEFNFFSDVLYGKPEASSGTLTVAESGSGKHVARSSGFFAHPAHAAYYFEYILPIVLGCLLAARRARDRILFACVLGAGCTALLLTFSRSGMVGFLVGTLVWFPIARWSGLISRQIFACFAFIATIAAVVGTPLLINFLEARPEAFNTRWILIERSVTAFLERPIWGAGLNNSSAVTEGARTTAGSDYQITVVHNYYLIVLVEVGIVGFLLFFGFFWQIVVTAVRHMRAAETEMKILLAGIVAALAGIAIHNFGDPFAGHSVQAMFWLHAGLLLAICRRVQAQPALPAARTSAPVTVPRLQAAAVSATRSGS